MLKNKSLMSLAEAVKKVWSEDLTNKQKKIDKNHNGKVDGQDLAILRKEGWDEMKQDAKERMGSAPKPNGGEGKKQGTAYGGSKQKDEKPLKEEDAYSKDRYAVKDGKAMKDNPTHKGSPDYADKPHHVWATSPEEAMQKKKSVKEEASQAEFTAELKKAQAKAAGTAKQAQVAKPAVQAVQNEQTHTEIQVIDLTNANGIKMSTIDLAERHLEPEEKAEMEKNVKGMKKNLSGFKDRYGDKAKSVMYATATKQAKGE